MSYDQPHPPSQSFQGPEVLHTQRVAAYCAEVAHRLRLPSSDCEALERAAIFHHRSKVVIDEASWEALCSDVGLACARPGTAELENLATELLQALHGGRPASKRIKNLAWILDKCDNLDNSTEFDALVTGEPEENGLDGSIEEVAAYLRAATGKDLEKAARKLPVFPAVAHRAFGLLRREETNVNELESIIAADPTLAGHILAAANSADMAGGRSLLADLGHAVARLGFDIARQVVYGASLRGMFGTRHSYSLWNHSLRVAQIAARLAVRSGAVDRDEAFLAGLVHDIGRLVILCLPDELRGGYDRLVRKACPGVIVERVVFGETHATIGARVLTGWRFPDNITEAVKHHHHPEQSQSALCGILYLAENSEPHDEAAGSVWRDQLARRLANGSDAGDWLGTRDNSALTSLLFAA